MTLNPAGPTPEFEKRPGFPLSFHSAGKRIRVVFAGETIVDATRAMVMHEDNCPPVYYFERDEVRMDLLTPTSQSSH